MEGQRRKNADRIARFASGRGIYDLWLSDRVHSHFSRVGYVPPTETSASVPAFEIPMFDRAGLEQECAGLREANHKLAEEVRQLRALLVRSQDKEPSSAKVCGPGPDMSSEDKVAAAEMLAELQPIESDVVMRVLGDEPQSIGEIVQTLGLSGSLRVSSLLATCHAAAVQGEAIVPTELGRALFRWIMAQTD